MANGDWWTDTSGTNLLKGVEDSITNPVLLDSDVIIDFLSQIPNARAAFLRMVPNMLPEEQDRLMLLYNCVVPPPSTMMDPGVESDIFQHRMNSGPVRTSGPRGGGSWAPPRGDKI